MYFNTPKYGNTEETFYLAIFGRNMKCIALSDLSLNKKLGKNY